MDLHTERELITRAQTDPEAFGEIFDAYYPKIVGYVLRRVGDPALAQDIVAEAFTKALQKLPLFRWQGVSIEAWLYKIATNELRMHFRGRRFAVSLDALYEQYEFEPEAATDLLEEMQTAQDAAERHERFLRARWAVDQLPEKYQEVLILRYVEGKKLDETAAILGKRPGTVKSLASRGLTQLRATLAQPAMQPIARPRIVSGGGQTLLQKPQEEYER